MMNPVYLDNAATTRVAPEVLEAMLPFLTEVYGNPSSPHRLGEPARRAVGIARGQVADFLGAAPAEIVFTGSATEANHTAVLGALAIRAGRRRIVTTRVEHPASMLLFDHLERQGYEVVRLPVEADGTLRFDRLAEAIDRDTALVSVMWANNETGVVLPVGLAASLAERAGALFHTDAVQAAGRLPVGVQKIRPDFLSLSAHKLHGPKGIGALYVKRGVPLPPLLFGHQERRRRGGTENVPAIVGLGEACRLAADTLPDVAGRVRTLRDHLEAGVTRALPWVRVNGHRIARVPTTSNLCFDGQDGEAVLMRLDRAGVAVSAGSACSAGGGEPSHVLTAMGLDARRAGASLRFSLSRYTTLADIEAVLDRLPEAVGIPAAACAL
ncbi:MAG: aminotransferase class V-fold PLP-dependent enzyme [Nitrospirae bacterium]|nr:aminotransferase class V-fold PLP-dependent enzyme [Nitrospirota bacterium]